MPVGTIVRLGVSTGVPPKATVPSVRGLTIAAARAKLQDAGFVVEVVEQEVTRQEKVGIVLQQDPKGGSERPEGSTVTLTVGVAAEEPPPE